MNTAATGLRWKMEDIPYDTIKLNTVRCDEFLFTTLASASFVEILAQTYSSNLIKHFEKYPEITEWLKTHWEPEEVQHGQALKRYVQTVWPEFDWEVGHAEFCADYVARCTVEQLESRPALELVARCVVETGTSTFYRAIHDYANEPVLRSLLEKIKTDEAAHYVFFRHQFALIDASNNHTALQVVATIWRRIRAVRGEDVYIAFQHVYATRHPGNFCGSFPWRSYNREVRRLARTYYPYTMAAKMLLKLVPLGAAIKRPLLWAAKGVGWLATVGTRAEK